MKYLYILFTVIIAILSSCNQPDTQKSINTQNTNTPKDSTISLINAYSDLIAGENCDEFTDVQNKNFYKNYEKSITTTWNYFYLNQLLVITNWAESNNITSKTDTLPVFYPFSGPDFPFLNAFFPYSNNYILVGLENIGVVPDFKQYSDLEIEQYLNSLSASMTDFFLNGYFSTQTMKYSFRNPDMNGVIHPLLFFIKKMNFNITKLKYFTLNNFGQIIYTDKFNPLEKNIKGIQITFDKDNEQKNLYYLQTDLSNQDFDQHPEFMTFINNFGEKTVLLKSASYLLHEDFMSTFKTFLYNQAVKILQDDSGFSYEFLKSDGFDISLFGNYSHTLNIFEKYWQKDLKDAYSTNNPAKLPFRFGYNIPFDETTLIFAKKQQSTTTDYPIFSIQFRMSWNKLPQDSLPQNLQNIDYYFDEGYYKYICGKFQTKTDAQNYLQTTVNKNFPNSFIIRFDENGKHIVETNKM